MIINQKEYRDVVCDGKCEKCWCKYIKGDDPPLLVKKKLPWWKRIFK